MATTTTNYGFDVPTSSDLVKNGATQIALLGQDLDTFLFRPFTRNALINGSMDIWQRGTSNTSPTTTTQFYAADRWNFFRSVAGATVTQQATNDTTNLPQVQYCIRVARDSGNSATNVIGLYQNLENVTSTPMIGQTVVMSFYARKGANYSAATLDATIASGTGTNENQINGLTGSATVATSGVTLTTTWQRFTVTGTVASSAKQLGVKFLYTPVGTAGANDYYEITGVQLEQGNQASPLARAGSTYATELAACQRYYYRNSDSTTNYASFIPAAITANTTQSDAYLSLPVTMRTKPSSVDFANLQTYDYVAGAAYAISNVTINSNSSPTIAVASLTFAAATAGRFIIVRGNNSSSAYLGFSAEL